jgi:hypothetical protein
MLMRKSLVVTGIVIAALVFAMPTLAATAKEAPEDVVIDQCMAKKSAVNFPHAAHFELTECTTCHHTNEGLTAELDVEVPSCASCHKDPEAAETPDCAQMSLSKNPYHVACVTCHKESGVEAAPTKCDGCHPKAG